MFGSALGLILLAPPLLLIAFAVKLTSRGLVVFVEERCGIGGRRFRFYQFPTMVQDAEARKRELVHPTTTSTTMGRFASPTHRGPPHPPPHAPSLRGCALP